MRRVDKAVTDLEEIMKIIQKCDVCRLGMADDNLPYIVPMSFGFTLIEGKMTLYFHCANEGKKLDIMRKNPAVCFEMDCGSNVIRHDENACSFSMAYESIIGNGRIQPITDRMMKEEALCQIMLHYEPNKRFSFSDKQLENITMLKLNVDTFEAKRSVKKQSS